MRLSIPVMMFAFAISMSSLLQAEIRHVAYVEAAGSGFIYSLNYELQAQHSHWLATGFRAGFGYWHFTRTGLGAPNGSFISIPLLVSSIIGQGSQKFEIGIGYIY